jgi:hypothetical protein
LIFSQPKKSIEAISDFFKMKEARAVVYFKPHRLDKFPQKHRLNSAMEDNRLYMFCDPHVSKHVNLLIMPLIIHYLQALMTFLKSTCIFKHGI